MVIIRKHMHMHMHMNMKSRVGYHLSNACSGGRGSLSKAQKEPELLCLCFMSLCCQDRRGDRYKASFRSSMEIWS